MEIAGVSYLYLHPGLHGSTTLLGMSARTAHSLCWIRAVSVAPWHGLDRQVTSFPAQASYAWGMDLGMNCRVGGGNISWCQSVSRLTRVFLFF